MKRFISLLVILCSQAASAQSLEQIERIEALLQPMIQPQAPGFAIGIVQNGHLIYGKGFGLSEVEKSVPISCQSVFGVASLAKQFTAACIWRLIMEDRISLDDDIRKFIPEFPDYGKKILVRHLLNHTSGIRNYHALMALAGFDYDSTYHDNQTILNLACRQKALNHAPGEKVIYGNTAYTLLAMMIERITGQNMADYANSNIFLPLGMTHTFYRTDTSSKIPDEAKGYAQNSDGSFEAARINQNTYGAGSLHTSVEDLTIWSNVLNGSNAVFPELTRFLTTTEMLHSGAMATYGRGVLIDTYKNLKTVHHSGFGLGGRAQILALPEINLAVIILTNTTSLDPTPLSYKIADVFIGPQKDVAGSSPPQFHFNKKEFKKFTGHYQEQNSDMKMEIFLDKDTLKARSSQAAHAQPLTAIEKGKFVRRNNPGVSYDFRSAGKSQADLIVYFGGMPFYFSRARFVDEKSVRLTDYPGLYYSEELSVSYKIYVKDKALFVAYPHHAQTLLTPGQQDEFGTGERIRYRFKRNRNNEVIKLFLSAEGTVKDIEFIKK